MLPSRAMAAETTASLIETGQLKFQKGDLPGALAAVPNWVGQRL